MRGWMLNYLFYVGIILPTVVTLALFVFFVICWRKQSARKAVLTKPYDPHGTMRRLGIPNRPPPPPIFLRRSLPSPRFDVGGEDNAAYDMSRSPSAEANASGTTQSGGHHLQFRASPSGDLELMSSSQVMNNQVMNSQVLQLHTCPSGDMDISSHLPYHNRLDSGLSEPACESPVGGASGGGGEGAAGGGRERPQSQASHASHSSHSTDSEDSGFRSSRSGQLAQTGQGCSSSHEQPAALKRSRSRSRSGGRVKGRGYYHKAATTSSSPDSEGDPPIQLTPTALWPHHPHIHTHHPNPPPPPHHPHHPASCSHDETGVKTTGVDLSDIGASLDWKYLQNLAYQGPQTTTTHTVTHTGAHTGTHTGTHAGAHAGIHMDTHTQGGGGRVCSPTHRQHVTCHHSVTLAHVHTSHDRDNPEALGFSVV